nr:TraR/DksA C4-type zinc finger protein [uncultured Rhodopila sp.]
MTVELPADYKPSETEEFLNPRQLEYFRQRLEKMRADLSQELSVIPHPKPDDGSREGDQADQASAETERDLEQINRDRVRILLRQTEQALVRLQNGSFGYCEDTGEPIGLKRLMAQPTTSLSRDAQEARERRAAR